MKQLVLGAVLLMALTTLEARAEPTGSALPGLEPYDALITTLLEKWNIAGAGLAVARGNQLLLVRGYGLASKEHKIAVEPASLFRLGSLSKTITAVAVLQLVQAGRLKLDDPVLPILGEVGPRSDRITDARVRDITVRHLLQHTGGFDRERSGDVVFLPGAGDVPLLEQARHERVVGLEPRERRARRLGPRLERGERDQQYRAENDPLHAFFVASKIARGFRTSICSIWSSFTPALRSAGRMSSGMWL